MVIVSFGLAGLAGLAAQLGPGLAPGVRRLMIGRHHALQLGHHRPADGDQAGGQRGGLR